MKKVHMLLYTTAVIGFYVSLVLLYMNTSSVAGTALLCMSILALGLGVFAQWRFASKSGLWTEDASCIPADSKKAHASC